MITLSSERLTLRTPEEADGPAIADAARTSFAELDPWMPWASADYGLDDALFWVNDRAETGFIMVGPDDSVLGTCGINGVDEANKRANLGYWVRTSHVGLGLATEATRLAATYGLADLGLHRIEVVMSVENEASRRVAERAGATYEGVLRRRLLLHGTSHDAHSFSITSLDQMT